MIIDLDQNYLYIVVTFGNVQFTKWVIDKKFSIYETRS